ncbi:uncharacterized protein LOC110974960 [Acanthaster planci]|uniref:Uncharacterized protein LOC110974960 n=1 Tax=Acanthaster planci TaxID=133434 RepID=A0A8B7XP99_ACAPL|nr:uncharacterized protein LOC110974960 [Acanthaster planci]
MATSSVLRTTDDFDPQKVGDWCDRNSVHDLSNEVRKGDLLEFDCKKPFGWAVCTSRSEDNVQVVFYSSFEKLSDGTLVTVLDTRRVRINNAIVHLQSLSDYNGLENNRLQVISHFLGNRSLNDFIFNRINNCERWADTSVVEVLVVLARVLLSSLELILDFARSHLPHQQTDVGNIGEKTTWYSKDQIDDLMSAVCFGDRLQYDRKGPYRHWGVCIGRLGGELLTLHFSPRGTGLKFATKKVSSSASYAKDSPQFRVDAAGRPIRTVG